MENKGFSLHKRLMSFVFAVKGIGYTVMTQHNIWIHCFGAICVVVLSILLNLSATEWCIVLFDIGFVICTEIFNTAIEMLVDLVSPLENKKAGIIKDISAGAVLVASIVAAIIGIIIFIPKL